MANLSISKITIPKTMSHGKGVKEIKIFGTPGASFELYIKQSTNYYNWDADVFQTIEKKLKNQAIPSEGMYVKSVVIPEVESDTSYDFYITMLPGSVLNMPLTHEQKAGVLYQKGASKTVTFTATESSTLVVQNSGSAGSDLTGGTLNNTTVELEQTGTITEASGKFVYCHSLPSWERATGGDWTLSNTVDSIVQFSSGTQVKLTYGGGTNVAVGDSVVGRGIVDEITVSAINGDLVTLSAAQNLADGQTLTFSRGAWEIGPLSAEIVATSGTTSILATTYHNISRRGIADLTCVLDIDSHFSVKPNAFPVTGIICPARGQVTISAGTQCTNYLGQFGDNDANLAGKRFKVHSVPTGDVTSRRPTGELDVDGNMTYTTLDFAGTSSVSASGSMGGAGVGKVVYTAHGEHKAGDEDYFYYKTTDAQTPTVDSSTTQGKISITIV